MAQTYTARGSASGYGDDPLVGDTFTPTEGNLIVLAGITFGGITSLSGWGISFVNIGSDINLTGESQVVYAGIVGASPGSDQLQVITSASTGYDFCVFEIGGDIDTSGTVANCFVQDINEFDYDLIGVPAISTGLSSFVNANSSTLTLQFSKDQSQTFTQQTGFTNLMTVASYTSANAVDYYLGQSLAPEYNPVSRFLTDGGRAFEMRGTVVAGDPSFFPQKQTLPTYILAR